MSLESLARNFFSNFTIGEMKLLEVAPTGQIAVCGPSDEDSHPTNYPRNADSWGEERRIRTTLIRWICRDPSAKDLVDPKGIQIYGAKLLGELDLTELRVPFRLALIRCRATEQILLRGIEIPLLVFDGSWVRAVKADGANVMGGVTLRNGFRAEQQVRLHRARIGTDLDCGGGTFINPPRKGVEGSGIALAADGATFGGGVFLRGVHAEGEVRLSRAHIRDDLDCSDAVFHNGRSEPDAGSCTALNADGVNVVGSIFIRRVRAEGEVRLSRAKVGADVDCGGARISNPFLWGTSGGASALRMEGSAIGGNVVLNDQFHAEGAVTLRGAQITGQLICSGGTFENRPPLGAQVSMPALDASLANVQSGVFLGPQFRAEGEVRMQAARIGAVFHCDHGMFNNPPRTNVSASGYALTADGLRVNGRVGMGPGFRAAGEVFLIGAQIEGDLDCGGGEFKNPPIPNAISGRALSAHRITVKGNVFIRSGFSSQGEVSFSGASIEGNLEATRAELEGELNLETARIRGALMLQNLADPKNFQLTLTNASVGALADETAAWPQRGNLLLDGFVYQRFSGPAPKDSESRLAWLSLQRQFLPQPYRQVARVLRDEGEDAKSVQVLYEMERLRWAQRASLAVKPWNFLLRYVIGYGYYPARALLWLIGLVLVGFLLFTAGFYVGSMVPVDKNAYAYFFEKDSLPSHYERFHALIYSSENSFPLVKLGQVDRWQPDPAARSLSSPGDSMAARFLYLLIAPSFLRWFRWGQILAGWFFATMGIAGLTKLIRRD